MERRDTRGDCCPQTPQGAWRWKEQPGRGPMQQTAWENPEPTRSGCPPATPGLVLVILSPETEGGGPAGDCWGPAPQCANCTTFSTQGTLRLRRGPPSGDVTGATTTPFLGSRNLHSDLTIFDTKLPLAQGLGPLLDSGGAVRYTQTNQVNVDCRPQVSKPPATSTPPHKSLKTCKVLERCPETLVFWHVLAKPPTTSSLLRS